MPITALVQEHRRILQLHYDIVELSHQPVGEPLMSARRALGASIARYLALKESEVIAPLRASPDPAHHALAKRCVEEEFQARQGAMEHYRRWTPQAIKADAEGFRKAVRDHIRINEERVEYEEQTVHAAVVDALRATSLRAA